MTQIMDIEKYNLTVEFEREREPSVMYYSDGSGHPGYDQVFIHKATREGVDVTDLIDPIEDHLIDEIYEKIE